MALYTRTGDDGNTGLFGGERVGKEHPRVEALGTVDELNAWLGLAAAACDPKNPPQERFLEILSDLQSRIFDLGADLATPPDGHRAKIAPISREHVQEVEGWIDEIDSANKPMRNFVLPAGTELAARLHVARSVCRRAERRLVILARITMVSAVALSFVNRISDLLFAMARLANKDAGVPDVPWIGKKA